MANLFENIIRSVGVRRSTKNVLRSFVDPLVVTHSTSDSKILSDTFRTGVCLDTCGIRLRYIVVFYSSIYLSTVCLTNKKPIVIPVVLGV